MADKRNKQKGGIEKLTPVLVIVSIVLAFAVGVLWQRVKSLEGGGDSDNQNAEMAGAAEEVADAPTRERPDVGKISDEQAEKVAEVTEDDHVRGNPEAPLTLIEYSDYECPFCSRFHSTAQQVIDEYEGQVKWVYRHFPLDQIHANARAAAEASECVADLGGTDAFWQFTDALYEDETKIDDLESVASEVGVSASAFNDCVESNEFADAVEEDYQSGLNAGVTGTPGNFIVNENGDAWFVPGAYPYDQIQGYIEEALDQS
jgi:protein-disulfide isomerase